MDDGSVATIYWQAISETEAVRWVEVTSDDETWAEGPMGLVTYATRVDADYLRSIAVGRLMPHRSGFAEFPQLDAPTELELQRAWNERMAVSKRRLAEAKALIFPPRSDDETPDDFYARVADFYLRAMASSGEPTKMLATVADVPKTTAARWVREARARGHLDPTTRGRRFA